MFQRGVKFQRVPFLIVTSYVAGLRAVVTCLTAL